MRTLRINSAVPPRRSSPRRRSDGETPSSIRCRSGASHASGVGSPRRTRPRLAIAIVSFSSSGTLRPSTTDLSGKRVDSSSSRTQNEYGDGLRQLGGLVEVREQPGHQGQRHEILARRLRRGAAVLDDDLLEAARHELFDAATVPRLDDLRHARRLRAPFPADARESHVGPVGRRDVRVDRGPRVSVSRRGAGRPSRHAARASGTRETSAAPAPTPARGSSCRRGTSGPTSQRSER